MKKINFILLTTLFLSSLALSGCNKQEEVATTHPKNMLRIDIGNEPASLDPQVSSDNSAARVQADLFAGLIDYDQNGKLLPGLAESWDIASDGKTYTFYLRPNIKFSDGSPITAQDFVFSWRRLIVPKTGATYNFILNSVVNAKDIVAGKMAAEQLGVAAPESSTFIVHLQTPDAAFLEKCAMQALSVLSEKNVEKNGEIWAQPDYIVTSGAYKLVSHVVNGSIRASKNPYYYGESTISIDKIIYLPYVDTNAAVAAYKTGDLDMTFLSVPVEQYTQLKIEYPKELHTVSLEGIYYYTFNTNLPQFKNPKLRQALSMAIDRDVLTKQLLNMGQTSLYSNVTPTIANGDYKGVKYAWANLSPNKRIAIAKKLYAEAGYSESSPLKISLLSNTNDLHKKIALAIIAMWQNNLGIKAELKNVEWKSFIQARYHGDFEIARGGWTGDYNSVTVYTPLYECGGRQNASFYCNESYDSLIQQANNELNPSKQHRLYAQALTDSLNDYTIIPLFQYSYQRLVKPYIANYDIDHNTSDHVQSKWFKFND